jgi:hypothetical protein
MELYKAFLAFSLVYLILHALVLPILNRRKPTAAATDIRATAVHATVEFLRTSALLATLASALVLVVTAGTRLVGGQRESATLDAWLQQVQSWRSDPGHLSSG